MENSPPEAWQLWISKSWISDNMYHIYGKLLLKPKSRELLTSIFMRPQNRLTNRRIQLCKFENYLGDNMPQNWEALGELQTGLTMTGRVSSWSSSIKRASDEHPCCESFPVVGGEQWSVVCKKRGGGSLREREYDDGHHCYFGWVREILRIWDEQACLLVSFISLEMPPNKARHKVYPISNICSLFENLQGPRAGSAVPKS